MLALKVFCVLLVVAMAASDEGSQSDGDTSQSFHKIIDDGYGKVAEISGWVKGEGAKVYSSASANGEKVVDGIKSLGEKFLQAPRLPFKY